MSPPIQTPPESQGHVAVTFSGTGLPLLGLDSPESAPSVPPGWQRWGRGDGCETPGALCRALCHPAPQPGGGNWGEPGPISAPPALSEPLDAGAVPAQVWGERCHHYFCFPRTALEIYCVLG